MSDSAPLYQRIPTLDDPTGEQRRATSGDGTTLNGHSTGQGAKDSFLSSTPLKAKPSLAGAQSALDSVQSHPTTSSFKNTVSNGPVVQQVKSEYGNTQDEFRNLANARTRPAPTAGTGQPLTHYHSMFSQLLSWENPRATGFAYLLSMAFILATRYLPLIRTGFRILYLCFGATMVAEVTGRLLFAKGFATQIRPRRYYTLPKGTVDRVLDDVHELLNFFVIEFQRILFAENLAYTIAAFVTALVSYFLTRLVPVWGLGLIGTSVLYLVPLVYVSNREMIDEQLQRISHVLNEQASRARAMAGERTARATETVKHYAGDYSAKAQDYLGHARQRTVSVTTDYAAKAQTAAATAKDRAVSATSDYSAKAQDNLAYAKNRTAATIGDTASKVQDDLGSAKDRTASASSAYATDTLDTLASAKDRVASAPIGPSSSDGKTSTSYAATDFPSAPTTKPTPIADQFASFGMNNVEDDEPVKVKELA